MKLLFKAMFLRAMSLLRRCSCLDLTLSHLRLHLHLHLVFQNIRLKPQVLLFAGDTFIFSLLLLNVAHFKEIRHILLQVLHDFASLLSNSNLEPRVIKNLFNLAGNDPITNLGLFLHHAHSPLIYFLFENFVIKWRIDNVI